MNSGYSGTISQASGQTISVGNGCWSLADGTFQGGDADVTVSSLHDKTHNCAALDISGGQYTATSALTTLYTYIRYQDIPGGSTVPLFKKTSGSFSHNNGHFEFRATEGRNSGYYHIGLDFADELEFWDVTAYSWDSSFNTKSFFTLTKIPSETPTGFFCL